MLEDLDNALQKLREDHDQLRNEHDGLSDKYKEEMPRKADKADLAELEARMMQRLQDMFDQLRQMFPDKEAINKKIKALEKNVSHTQKCRYFSSDAYFDSCVCAHLCVTLD